MRRLFLCALFLGVGCAGATLKSRASAVGEVISTARTRGAQKCAPVELAMAESHHAFAAQELAEGNYYRARQELRIAEKNANDAVRKSPIEKCGEVVAKTVGDADGDGIKDDVDECPKVPEDIDGFEDEDGCPDKDNDNDGILDTDDECPDDPEDKDNFEDEDGCPDKDNDKDGLADKVDACPDEAEDKDGHEDDDGCPDCDNDGDGVLECPEEIDKCPDKFAKTADGCPQYKLVVVTAKKIELKQTVYFETAKYKIKKVSHRLLNEVGQALADNPKIRVRIEGHTDSRGSDRYNLKLSKGRSAAVMEYLIGRGVDPDRMISEGYGEGTPIADNRTAAGRQQNRRVEFMIISR